MVAPGQRYVPTVAAASSRGAYLVLGSQRVEGESEGGGGGVFRAVTDSGGHYTSRRTPVLPPTAMPARTLKLSKKL